MPSVPIPQDIINEVLYHLRGHSSTLKICSIVSQSFSQEARKHLFSVMLLYDASSAWRFHFFLTRNPILAAFIIDLRVAADKTKQALPLILPLLVHLRHLVIDNRGGLDKFWAAGFLPRLANFLETHTLHSFTLLSMYHIPISFLLSLHRVKTIKLDQARIIDDMEHSDRSTPVMQLESLQISQSVDFKGWHHLKTPHLCQISMESMRALSYQSAIHVIQQKKSIKDFLWI